MATVDFSAAYRDSSRGSTIKAMQQRRAHMAQMMETAMAPRQIDSPWQGASQIAEVIGGGIREARASNEENAARQRFAQLLAGGLTPDEMGEAVSLDPDIAMKYQENAWTSEREKEAARVRQQELVQGHGWDVDAATARVQAEQAAAAERARQDALSQEDTQTHQVQTAETLAETQAAANAEKARVAAVEAEKLAAQPDDPVAQAVKDFEAGNMGDKNDPATKLRLDERIATINAAGQPKSAGWEAMDKKFADEALEWKQTGGANITRQSKQIKETIDLLNKGRGALYDVTGRVAGTMENAPDWLKPWLNPQGQIAKESIQSVVQESLKSVLGSQFAAVEGEQLLKRSFNPALSVDENIRRAGMLMDQIGAIAERKQAMVEHFDKFGSLRDYSGPQLDIGSLTSLDFGNAEGGDTGTTSPPAKPGIVKIERVQ